MPYCLNPACPQPQNPERNRFCESCGRRLRLGDRYEAVYSVGSGQNSHTFVGRDRATLVQPQCLIKQFTPTGNTVLEREAAAERFRKDVEHLAIASQHPQIPDLLAYFERERHQYLVQQFLVGPHLDQCLQEKRGPFDSNEVFALLRNVLPILHHLHQNRIIHRDIKPTNFRRPPGQPHWWLVDLGAIKPLTATRMAQPGTLIGSADYAAPEQLRGEATFASDLYSLGVVCLHLLTGLQPFDLFDSVNGCWHWRSIVPDVSPSLATLLDGMIQPAWRDRLPDVETAMVSLGLSVPPPPDPPSAPVRPKSWQPERTVELSQPTIGAASLFNTADLLVLKTTGQVEGRSLQALDPIQYMLQLERSYPSAIAAHPAQSAFVIGTRQGLVESWHQRDGRWQSRTLMQCDRGVTQLLFTRDGETLFIADERGCLQLWDWQTNRPKTTWKQHSASISSLALSHSGTTLASGDTQGIVKLWNVSTGECLRSLSQQQGAITALTWLIADQALVTAGWDVTLRWRCPQTGGILQSAKAQGFYLPVRSLLAHPTAPLLITGSQDGQLQCWLFDRSQELGNRKVKAIASVVAPIMALCTVPTQPNHLPKILSLTEAGQLNVWDYPV